MTQYKNENFKIDTNGIEQLSIDDIEDPETGEIR